MRFPLFVATMAVVLIPVLTGCGKIPTWGELTGETPPPAPATPIPSAAPVAPVQPAVPAGPTSSEVIAQFQSLRSAEVSDVAITRLTALKEGLDQITEINADGSGVTKDAFGAIEKLTHLRQLRLDNSRVNDEACQNISKVSSLEVIALTGTAVSDVGVAALSLENRRRAVAQHRGRVRW